MYSSEAESPLKDSDDFPLQDNADLEDDAVVEDKRSDDFNNHPARAPSRPISDASSHHDRSSVRTVPDAEVCIPGELPRAY